MIKVRRSDSVWIKTQVLSNDKPYGSKRVKVTSTSFHWHIMNDDPLQKSQRHLVGRRVKPAHEKASTVMRRCLSSFWEHLQHIGAHFRMVRGACLSESTTIINQAHLCDPGGISLQTDNTIKCAARCPTAKWWRDIRTNQCYLHRVRVILDKLHTTILRTLNTHIMCL